MQLVPGCLHRTVCAVTSRTRLVQTLGAHVIARVHLRARLVEELAQDTESEEYEPEDC